MERNDAGRVVRVSYKRKKNITAIGLDALARYGIRTDCTFTSYTDGHFEPSCLVSNAILSKLSIVIYDVLNVCLIILMKFA